MPSRPVLPVPCISIHKCVAFVYDDYRENISNGFRSLSHIYEQRAFLACHNTRQHKKRSCRMRIKK